MPKQTYAVYTPSDLRRVERELKGIANSISRLASEMHNSELQRVTINNAHSLKKGLDCVAAWAHCAISCVREAEIKRQLEAAKARLQEAQTPCE